MNTLNCGPHKLDLNNPVVMGILNVTPDSFSDGGKFNQLDAAIRQAETMVAEGADIIDIGGESTRPGAKAVSVQQEIDRVIPLVEKLSRELDVGISVDTNKAQVMTESASAGAGMINDVMALQNEGALQAAASLDSSIAICLMHMQGQPRTMQQNPQYDDVVQDIFSFLEQRVEDCIEAGMSRHQLCIDPGFGFGKTLEQNLSLLKNLVEFSKMELPLLVGISRKSMLGTLLGDVPPEQRIDASIAAAVLAYERGAQILRVHDVRQTVDALKIASALISRELN
ncbi:MAG: dihydropteroate synthase [Gammaproteobacteria bacterium]|nr:dihydropteroate synthase [Gammaproteobacteria bacterium]